MSMAAVLCHANSLKMLSDAIDEVVALAVEKYGVNPGVELHISDMLNRSNGWERLPHVNSVLEIAEVAISKICRIENLHFVAKGIDIRAQLAKNYSENWDPRRLGIQYVLERCDEVVLRKPPLIVVADQMSKPEIHQQLVRSYREKGTPGFRKTHLNSLIDNLYFMPSESARGIQAADLIANIHRRKFDPYGNKPTNSIEANEHLWSIMWGSWKVRMYGTWPN